MQTYKLIACQECDALHRETSLPPGGAARCRRCDSVLYRHTRDGLDRTLAFTLAAFLVFLLANIFPILGLEVQGIHNASTLFGAVRALYDQDMLPVAALVLVTAIVAPGIQLAAMIYLLLPLRLGLVPPGFPGLFRIVQALRPWGMVEVFMLGVLVSLVKLAHIAHVVPGIALWSFGALMMLVAAGAASFDAWDLWSRVAAVRSQPAPEAAEAAR